GKKIKKISEISEKTGLSIVRVAQECKKLRGRDMIELYKENGQLKKVSGELAYIKKDFFTLHRDKILNLAKNKKSLEKISTKSNPKINVTSEIIRIKSNWSPRIEQISIEDIDNFKGVKNISSFKDKSKFYEKDVKTKFKKILYEEGDFTDWGGEKNDLFTTRVKFNGKRIPSAFAFKGKGTTGILTPKKMGKNADQIQRLFQSPAEIFFVQYNGQIAQSIIEQMKNCATINSLHDGKKIYFGVIDGLDTNKIMQS
ncbi:MAG: hypothetical protein Q7S06_00980, partial [Nanoarchaeota archaeon]|nr:hypothetical protein [Nanoarchaeota archaeon]